MAGASRAAIGRVVLVDREGCESLADPVAELIRARAFYQHQGFLPLVDHPNRLYQPVRSLGKT